MHTVVNTNHVKTSPHRYCTQMPEVTINKHSGFLVRLSRPQQPEASIVDALQSGKPSNSLGPHGPRPSACPHVQHTTHVSHQKSQRHDSTLLELDCSTHILRCHAHLLPPSAACVNHGHPSEGQGPAEANLGMLVAIARSPSRTALLCSQPPNGEQGQNRLCRQRQLMCMGKASTVALIRY